MKITIIAVIMLCVFLGFRERCLKWHPTIYGCCIQKAIN